MSGSSSVQERLTGLSREQRALLFEQIRRRKERGRTPPERIPRRPPDLGSLPLSFAQERLWFIDRLEPGLAAYNVPLALRIEGETSPAFLAAILGEVVRRHESLRTTFGETGGRPVQLIAPPAPWRLPLVDLAALPEPGRAAEARRLAQAESVQPFDLGRGPLLRAVLLRLAPADHALLLSMHHIVSDGWSLGVLVREITALYGAAISGAVSPLPELPIQYADFAVWQRQRLRGDVLEEQLVYWRERLAGVPASLDLPTDRPRSAAPVSRGNQLRVMFGPEVARGLVQLVRRHEASLYMVLLAGFQALLSRLSGQEDIAIGSPIANRHRTEVEPLIGFFVNTLVMRGDLRGDPSFEELIGRVRRTTLEAYTHQDLPFERLVEELRPERHLSANPLVQVVFAMQNAPVGRMELPGLSLSPLPFQLTTALFDLELDVWEGEDGALLAVFSHNTDLLDRSTVLRIAGHLETLLREASAAPEKRLSELRLLGAAQRHQLLAEWNDTAAKLPREDVAELFAEQTRRRPGAVAVSGAGEELTYAELDRRSSRLARRLVAAGVGPEVRVALLAQRSPALVVGILGIVKAAGAYVPLDPSSPAERLAWMLSDCGAGVLLAEPGLLLPPGLSVPTAIELIELSADPPEAAGPDPGAPVAGALAYVMYTSGSTGRPKGVGVTHRNIVRLVRESGFADLGPDQVFLQLAAISFDASTLELWAPLLNGGRLAIMPPHQPSLAELGEAISRFGVTSLWLTAGLFHQMVDDCLESLRPLRQLLAGGDVLSPPHVRRALSGLPDTTLINGYGPTEGTTFTCCFPMTQAEPPEAAVPIGRPIGNTRVHVLDWDLSPVPCGVRGELCAGGDGVSRGYLGHPGLTAERFVPDPFAAPGGEGSRLYRTGDVVRFLADGRIEFLGRRDEQVKLRGFRVELREIESALARLPFVAAAVVVVAREAQAAEGKRLVAYCVVSQDVGEATGPEAAEHVAQWRTLYDETYGQGPDGDDAGFDLRGWNSSYNGEPIPAGEMREWVDGTVGRLLSLDHRRVLEVGCGTGLLLFRVAPGAERYVGTDFSSAALDLVRREADRRGLAQVELARRKADDWTGVEPGSFDLVVLNSVVQYFPGVDYLLRVLAGAVRAVRPGGAVFVGDVRSLPLLAAFHESVERYRAGDSLPEEELQRRVGRRVADEEELVLDPALFRALAGSLPLRRVEVLAKDGRHQNELTRFRYDVVLHIGEGDAVAGARQATPADLPWRSYANDPLRTKLARALVPELRRALQAQLPNYMVPSAFVLLDALPLTAHGKVDRAALPAPEPLRAAGSAPPRTTAELALAEIWQELLGAGQVGVADNFFDLGGHSLLATQLVSRLRASLQVEVPLRIVFEHPILGDLATAIDALRHQGRAQATQIPRRDPGGSAIPLSFAQERLWFIHRLEPRLTAYNVPLVLRIEGEISPAVLAAILGEVIRRHEILRTTFRETGGRPVQVIAPPGPWRLPLVDLAALPADRRDGEAWRLAREEASRPFGLERGPLLRAVLLRLAAAEHVLAFTMHHSVSDGWSMGVLVREITALYGAAVSGTPSPLSELPIQYADFAVWQRQRLKGEVLEEQLAYWRQRLTGVPAALDLPADRPRPAVPTYRGARLRAVFGPDFARGVAQLARRHKASPYMVLLSGFQALLGRLGGQEDLAVGSPIANRHRAEVEPLIGFFVNTLVLRADLSGDPAFDELLGRTRRTTLEAYAHQDLPFERLVEELRPQRHLSLNPLFQAICAMQNAPVGRMDLPGLSLSPVELEATTAQFDLELNVWEADDALLAALAYSTELFDAATVRRIVGHLEMLLRGAMADPERRLSELPLLTELERHQLLGEWNVPGRTSGPRRCLHERFESVAASTPEAIAVTHEVEALTYGELNGRANRLARQLLRLGAGHGRRVALFIERSLDLVVAVLGTLKAGAAYVPLDPAYPAERLAFILDDSRPDVIVTQARLWETLPNQHARSLFLDVDPPAGESEENLGVRVSAVEPAYVIYTSGSTGRPKGVVVRHAEVDRLFAATEEWFGFGPGDIWTLFHSYAFDFAVWELWGALLHGGRLVVVPFDVSRSPERFHELLASEGVTVLNQTPAAFRQLVEAGLPGDPGCLALRLVIFGGEALDPGSLAPWFARHGDRIRLANMYGITETTVHVTYRPLAREDVDQGRSLLGRAIPDLRLAVLDRHGWPVPIGVPGEICVGGDALAMGYLDRPDLTAARFVPDPFAGEPGRRLYRSGDLARYRSDGDLEYLERIDRQVKIRGFRIELAEIEAALGDHSGVSQAVVVVRDGGRGDQVERLVAYVVPRPTMEKAGLGQQEAEPMVPKLRHTLRAKLPDYMVPSAFVLLDSLPLTAHGKVDRAALPAPEPPSAAGATPPRTPIEIALAGIWKDLLGVEEAKVEDNFFDLGGHSLLATQLVSRLRASLQVEVPLRIVFEHPILGDLAAAIASAGGEPALQEEIRGALAREAPLSFSQERLWFLDRLLPGSWVYNIPSPMRLRGPLEPEVLARCFAEIVWRHESLRTRFEERKGAPVQVVDPPAPVPMPRIDLSALPVPQRRREAERVTAWEATLPFDLERGPVLRFILVRLGALDGAEEHAVLMTMHHIVSDGWSVGVFFGELTRLYEAFATGRPSPLPPLPVQYPDFARWQRDWLTGERLEEQLAYWRGRLGGHPPGLDLPRDRPRPAIQTFRGGAANLELPRGLSERLKALALTEKSSPFMLLLAAFEVLLQRLSGQEDVLVGTPVAGRTRPEIEGLIGFFLNTLVLRTDLSGWPAFRELVRRVRAAALGAYTHQDVPFERLLEDLQPERDLSRTPLFEVFFNFLNFPPSRAKLPGGVSVEPLEFGETESKFDLTIYAMEGEEGFIFKLVYNADLFDRSRMEEMLRQYRSLLSQVVLEPDRSIDSFSLLTAEATALLPDPREPLGEEGTGLVHELFADQARRRPERIALADVDGAWTYGELHHAVRCLAGCLRANGVQPGDRVAIHAHRSAPLVWAIFSVLEAGAAFVILDPTHPPSRLARGVDLANPRAVLAIAAAGEPGEELADRLAEVPLRLDLPGGGPAGARVLLADLPADLPEAEVRLGPDDLALVAFTSGSTGGPKGILGRHGPLSHFLPWQRQRFDLSGNDRHSMLSGLSHDPLQRDVFGALCTGATLCIPSPEDFAAPGRLAAWMAREEVSVSNLTPAMAQMLTEPPGGGAEAPEIPSLRWAFLIGDVLTRRDVERLHHAAPGVTCVNLYGATETQRALGYHVVERSADLPPVLPLGRGMKDCQLLVLDRAGRLAGIGEVGEIAIRSPHLARGYLGDEALTRERFLANPFTGRPGDRIYRTGDLGRYLPDGQVAFAGRADGQVQIRGFRVETGEIETVLGAQPGIREAVVMARETPGAVGDRRLVAYVVADPERPPDPVAVREALRRRLPVYMIPSAYVVLERLPLLPNGKVDRRSLPEPAEDRQAEHVPPSTPTEETLAEIWRSLMGVERIGAGDDFFRLGGHSLLATRVAARARDAFGIELPLSVLFQETTLSQLAAWINRERAQRSGPALPKIQARRRSARAAEVLSSIEDLSETEVQEILHRKKAALEGGSR